MTPKITAAITAVGAYVPEDKLTNADLEKMVETTDEWIRTRTGIEERRILKGAGKATSDMVVPAVKHIFEKRGIGPGDIDCMIVATVTPDMVFPATANIPCDKLGIKNAFSFDLSAAMIVMGAYGHSPARERLFGGVTRSLLSQMTVPVLMEH